MRASTHLAIAASALFFASSADAQTRLNVRQAPSNPTMVRIPPSSQLGTAAPQTGSSPTKSLYPAPIRQDFDPTFLDPTTKNPNLRKR